ncbi:MAG: MTAP family purine nucleoside phosphorylase, partial [bacterium]
MLTADVALIGGTGIGSRLRSWGGTPFLIPTRYGPMRGRLLEWEGITLATVARHSVGHRNPPHMVNYRALALGCKALCVKATLASAAVGSLRMDWNTGTLAICGDSIDLSARNITMYENEIRHTDVTRIFPLHDCMSMAANELGLDVKNHATYVCANGPRFETPGEIKMMRAAGGDIVGMTASSEAVAFREAGIEYGCLAVV